MIKLKYYPRHYGLNQYFDLFYNALAPVGVVAEDGLQVSLRGLRALPPADRPDVIQFHWNPEELWRWDDKPPRLGHLRWVARLWLYLRVARRLGIRVVWTVHDLVHHDSRRAHPVDAWGYRVLARMADLVICHTDHARDEVVRRYGARRAGTVVMPHGNYDGVYPPPRPKAETVAGLGLDPTARTLVCFGMVRPYKNTEVAIEAVRRLGAGYQLVVAGIAQPPAYADQVRAAAAGAPNVRLILEYVDRQRLADLVAAADCALLPYRQITGSGALMAALSLGRGVVASDLPFFRDVLALGPEAGVLCPPDDPGRLARAVEAFFDRPPDDRHAAARRLADRFSWGAVVAPVAEWFRRTFPGRAAPGGG